MSLFSLTALPLLVFTLTSASAPCQEPPPEERVAPVPASAPHEAPARDSAEEQLAKHEARLAEATSFSYDGVFGFGVGTEKKLLHVVLQRADPAPRFRIASPGSVSVHDGETLTTWSLLENRVLAGQGDRAFVFRDMQRALEPLLLDGGTLALSKFRGGSRQVEWGERRDLDHSGSLSQEFLIELEKEDRRATVSLWMDPSGLPRQWVQLDERGRSVRFVEYHNLRLDPELAPDVFHLDVPEGVPRQSFDEVMAELMARAAAAKPPKPILEVGAEVADWQLTAADGATVRLSELRGKVIVLDFWATWCGPCKIAMPGVQRLHADFKDRSVVVFGVNVFETDEAAAKRYWTQNGNVHRLLMGGDPLAKEYGFKSIPTFIVFDRQGKIAFSGSGATNEPWVRRVLEALADPVPAERSTVR